VSVYAPVPLSERLCGGAASLPWRCENDMAPGSADSPGWVTTRRTGSDAPPTGAPGHVTSIVPR
jgi:hypothetical protein